MKNRILTLIILCAAHLNVLAQFTEPTSGFLSTTDNVGIGEYVTQPTARLSIKDGGDGSGNGILNFDWTHENNWGGNSNQFAGYIGFNAFRSDGIAKDNYLRANAYTKRLAFEGGNNGFRWLAEDNVPNAGSSVSYLQLNELMVLKTNGFLGIGSQTPVSLLTVQQSSNDSSGGLTISDVGGYRQINIYGEGSGGRQVIKTNTANPLVFDLFGAERMRISSNGNVGIGTTNPQNELTVKGTIHCEEVLVDLNIAPDYVFETYYNGFSDLKPDYVMPTLEEVEAFTKANNHLPDVPSAKEIQENGLQLKEMTNILLQKIEELTLYTIEQEKRIKALEAKLTEKE